MAPPSPSPASTGDQEAPATQAGADIAAAERNAMANCPYARPVLVDGLHVPIRRLTVGEKNETDALQEKVKTLESIITVLSLGSETDAREMLKTMRDKAPSPATGSTLPLDEVLGEWHRSREKDVEYNAETAIYTPTDLPSERSVHYGVNAYFRCSYTLFHIYEKNEMTDIMNRVYRPRGPIDKATLCELCALTAIGSHYDADNFDVDVMESLYSTAALYLSDCIEAHFLRGMRVILCLSMYSFMTKRISARHSLAMGLSIARQARSNVEQMPPELWVPFRKVYRSFVFMECWLSSSLGYQPGILPEEIDFTTTPIEEPQPTTENDIQRQLSAVGLLMANILKDIYGSNRAGIFELVQRHMDNLQEWETSLPPEMKLVELKQEQGNVFNEPHRRSLILVHVMFLGARMLLQRKLLVTMAQERMNRRWTLDGSYEEGRAIERCCVAAAEECVTLLDVLGYTRHMFRRCWLCIGHAFSACSVILFDVAQRLLYSQRAGVMEQLARSQECINMLDGCGEADRVAKAMLQIVLPLHQQLQNLASDQPTTQRSGIHNLLEDPLSGGAGDARLVGGEAQIRSAVIPAMQTAIEVLGNPFGHLRRNNIDSFATGDPSVPSWWN
ncbi:hypothetical protein H2200_000638 [Cladophialophora chaetospira]|uniref:Transcription factor domain-containing protein n=1 Tax=Cladophialophora chaetospira TaxID=386627 RepID=A0AA38XNS7_9EURO|nr:hypothetical protein H2200_000638 [Cladophialophora chaetospira]